MIANLVQLYAESDALELARLVAERQVSVKELVETAIHLIEAFDAALNAVVIRVFEQAREDAKAKVEGGVFSGVPFLLKNIGSQWEGTPLTASLPNMRDFVCNRDSMLSRRIRSAGFVLLGRTNVPENGWSLGTEPSMYGPTRNPWDLATTPGGSSGGASAAVAAGFVPVAEGSDGGGSIRVPASCCGLVGLKPSRGRTTNAPQIVDRWFGGAYTHCLTKSVRDTASFLDVVAGDAVGDIYFPGRPERSWLSELQRALKPLRIGFMIDSLWGRPTHPRVAEVTTNVLNYLSGCGHHVEQVRLSLDFEQLWSDYNDIVAVETVTGYHRTERTTGIKFRVEDLAPFNQAQYRHAVTLDAVDYSERITSLRETSRELCVALAAFDILVTPTLTQLPRPLDYWSLKEADYRAYLDRWTDAAFMFPFNISGLPAVSIPGPTARDEIPIGVQLVGRYGDEAAILQLAAQLEADLPWKSRRPSFGIFERAYEPVVS